MSSTILSDDARHLESIKLAVENLVSRLVDFGIYGEIRIPLELDGTGEVDEKQAVQAVISQCRGS